MAGPLVAIVGETASGKSALALELAKRFDGEIIAADARTVYKEMDIGTAKPGAEDRSIVPHHLLDVTTPDIPLTASRFKALATEAITRIESNHHLPFLVGGSGLYIDGVLFDYSFSAPADKQLRRELQGLSVEELQARLRELNIALPENLNNPRHLIRRLETGDTVAERRELRPNTLVIGLQLDPAELKLRVVRRLERMLQDGLVDEVRSLSERYGWDIEPMRTIGYREFRPYLSGQTSLDEVKLSIVKSTLAYAKRQRTWFRRNKSIHWVADKYKAVDLITTFLNT